MRKMSLAAIAIGVFALVAALLFRPAADQANAAQGASPPSSADQAAAAARERRKITDDPMVPTNAPKAYDVTIVEYFDYQCPYCRKAQPVLAALLASDPKIRLVYRDWPMFGGASITAAKLALAAKHQGKYVAFHDALMQSTGKLDDKVIRAAADKAGVNWSRLQTDLKTHQADIDALLDRTSQQAAMMGLQGTPGFLIGPYLVPGGMDYANMKKAVAMVRANPTGDPAKEPKEQ
jgi:protein-disulfide isomerase